MVFKNLINEPATGRQSFGLKLYKISIGLSISLLFILLFLVGSSILFILLATSSDSSGSAGEGAVMMLILPMILWIWLCIVQVPFGIYGVIYNRRHIQSSQKKKQFTILIVMTIFCSLPLLSILGSYPGIVFNIYHNFTGKNIDLTKYTSYSIVKNEIDSCNIDFVDWRPINDVGGYFKGNVQIDVYVKEPSEHERYILQASEKNRLYTDLSQSTCNYSINSYQGLKGTDYNGQPY